MDRTKEIYDELEKEMKIPKDFDLNQSDENSLFFEYYFLEDDANELLANIGLDQNMNLSDFPRDQLKRIFRYYHPKQEKEENGKKEFIDPLPEYRAGCESYEKEMFKFGYELGKGGTIGIYYRLLPNFQFRRGYWVGKMERSIELNDHDILRELSTEIKVYDAKTANEEIGYIINNIYKENFEIEKKETNKGLI